MRGLKSEKEPSPYSVLEDIAAGYSDFYIARADRWYVPQNMLRTTFVCMLRYEGVATAQMNEPFTGKVRKQNQKPDSDQYNSMLPYSLPWKTLSFLLCSTYLVHGAWGSGAAWSMIWA